MHRKFCSELALCQWRPFKFEQRQESALKLIQHWQKILCECPTVRWFRRSGRAGACPGATKHRQHCGKLARRESCAGCCQRWERKNLNDHHVQSLRLRVLVVTARLGSHLTVLTWSSSRLKLAPGPLAMPGLAPGLVPGRGIQSLCLRAAESELRSFGFRLKTSLGWTLELGACQPEAQAEQCSSCNNYPYIDILVCTGCAQNSFIQVPNLDPWHPLNSYKISYYSSYSFQNLQVIKCSI